MDSKMTMIIGYKMTDEKYTTSGLRKCFLCYQLTTELHCPHCRVATRGKCRSGKSKKARLARLRRY